MADSIKKLISSRNKFFMNFLHIRRFASVLSSGRKTIVAPKAAGSWPLSRLVNQQIERGTTLTLLAIVGARPT